MENFRDCFQDDIENAFFDLNDFASNHRIDGKECTVILIENTNMPGKMSYGLMKSTLNPKESAIDQISHTLYIRQTDLRKKVSSNSMIELDGKKMFVRSVQNTEGVYKIEIGIHAV